MAGGIARAGVSRVSLPVIAERMAAALRTSQDRCIRDYTMKVIHKCSRCAALEAYDAFVSIVQQPGVKARLDQVPNMEGRDK